MALTGKAKQLNRIEKMLNYLTKCKLSNIYGTANSEDRFKEFFKDD